MPRSLAMPVPTAKQGGVPFTVMSVPPALSGDRWKNSPMQSPVNCRCRSGLPSLTVSTSVLESRLAMPPLTNGRYATLMGR
jgi:hypothetical protein